MTGSKVHIWNCFVVSFNLVKLKQKLNLGSLNFIAIISSSSSSSSLSSSSCHQHGYISNSFSPPLPIVHRFQQVFRATSCIYREPQYVGSSWSPCFCSSMWRGPQEYITYELVPTSLVGVNMCQICFTSFYKRFLTNKMNLNLEEVKLKIQEKNNR